MRDALGRLPLIDTLEAGKRGVIVDKPEDDGLMGCERQSVERQDDGM